jgi:proteasome accessory factor C
MLLNLMAFLANHPESPVETVCDVFGLSRKQLVSAVNEILMCGIPPYGPSDYVAAWIEGERVVIANADFMRRLLWLTVPEAVSLKMMIEDFIRQSPGVFKEAAQSLAAKIDALLGRTSGANASIGASRGKDDEIERALERSRALEIEYYSRMTDKTMRRVVEPLAIVDLDGRWYLAAYCRLRKAERTFRIDRIRRAKMLEERVERARDVDVSQYVHAESWFALADAPKVKATFAPEAARWAREQFARWVTRGKRDGSVECRLPAMEAVAVGDVIAEYAGSIVVKGVPELRRIFRRRVNAVRKLYGRASPCTTSTGP